MDEHIKGCKFPAVVKESVRAAFRERWDGLTSPLHMAGFALDPEFWEITMNTEVRQPFTPQGILVSFKIIPSPSEN